jgi:hypothetical protein
MVGLKKVVFRLALGAVSYAALAFSLARTVPFTAHAILGTAFALSFVIFWQPIILGFGSPRLRHYFSCLVAAAVIWTVGYVLLSLRAFTSGG